jgi:site-specific recombinase XerD
MSPIAATLQSFFTDRLAKQTQASRHTIASYRDRLRLLLDFLQRRTGRPPSRLGWDDLDADAICAFLDHLETDRHNSARTRNARLTAIRSLFTYAALRHPEHAALIARVLAIPPKRFDKTTVSFLDDREVTALLAALDAPPGTAAGTTLSCSSRSRPRCGSPNCSTSTAATSRSEPADTCAAKAKAANTGRFR